MATPLVLQFGGASVACSLNKVDRSKLYGYVDTEVLDDAGRRCRLMSLAADGHTLIESGGTMFATLSAEGQWLEKGQLKPVDAQGRELTPVASSLKEPIELKQTATADDLLAHAIHASYLLEPEEGAFDPKLVKELEDGAIYSFPFSYRGGLNPDVAFLLAGAEGGIWMLLGKPAQIQFLGLEQAAAAEAAEEEDTGEEDEEEGMDFGMM